MKRNINHKNSFKKLGEKEDKEIKSLFAGSEKE